MVAGVDLFAGGHVQTPYGERSVCVYLSELIPQSLTNVLPMLSRDSKMIYLA